MNVLSDHGIAVRSLWKCCGIDLEILSDCIVYCTSNLPFIRELTGLDLFLKKLSLFLGPLFVKLVLLINLLQLPLCLLSLNESIVLSDLSFPILRLGRQYESLLELFVREAFDIGFLPHDGETSMALN